MKILYSWLEDYVDLRGILPEELAQALTNLGLEVEGAVEHTGPQFKNVVVAKVLALAPHPNADKLRLVTVDCGDKLGQTQVVCGAPNVAQGQVIAFALDGATVYSKKQQQWFVLGKANIRGVDSAGMVCSLEELALETQYPQQNEPGIWVLNSVLEDVVLGEALESALGLEKDAILHTAPTANRGDWMSYVGVAREVSARFNRPLTVPAKKELPENLPPSSFSVNLPEPDVCQYYAGAVLSAITIGPSPAWLVKRLEAAGVRAINNVVDVTNYVMLELGQPLHVFDLAKLGGAGSLCVRRAKTAETLFTLDEQEPQLTEEAVVIDCNGQPVALAGVMGGLPTAIDDATTEVFLEAAAFPSVTTRRSARSVGIRTESSARFERGLDAGGTFYALQRAIALLEEIAGAELKTFTSAGRTETDQASQVKIGLSLTRLEKLIGKPYELQQIQAILTGLGFEVVKQGETALEVTVPSFRAKDVSQEADLIEEIVRIDGYNNIPATLPANSAASVASGRQKNLQAIRKTLEGLGFDEVMAGSLVGKPLLTQAAWPVTDNKEIGLSNTHSQDYDRLRPSLVPGLLEILRYNTAQGAKSLWLYELGRVYERAFKPSVKQTGVIERLTLGVLLYGPQQHGAWQPVADPTYYTLKGVFEVLMEVLDLKESFNIELPETQKPDIQQALAGWHPGQVAVLKTKTGKLLGTLGQIHPVTTEALRLKRPVYVLELDIEALLKLKKELPLESLQPFKPSLYPQVERDMALLASKTLAHQTIVHSIEGLNLPELLEARLFDEYEGPGVDLDKRSLAYRLSFQSAERTLTDAEVDEAVKTVKAHLAKTLQVTFR